MLRSEQEIRDLLSKCKKVAAFGMSKGPCPLNEDGQEGCCAECSASNTLRWVLGGDDNPSHNAQDLMGKTLEGLGQ